MSGYARVSPAGSTGRAEPRTRARKAATQIARAQKYEKPADHKSHKPANE
jgi:hypothetical protein